MNLVSALFSFTLGLAVLAGGYFQYPAYYERPHLAALIAPLSAGALFGMSVVSVIVWVRLERGK